MTTHLNYNLQGAYCSDVQFHPQQEIKRLGITYNHSTPQSMGDCWFFWNCENLPNSLPDYLTEINIDPMNCIGYGLSQVDAEKIRDYKSSL